MARCRQASKHAATLALAEGMGRVGSCVFIMDIFVDRKVERLPVLHLDADAELTPNIICGIPQCATAVEEKIVAVNRDFLGLNRCLSARCGRAGHAWLPDSHSSRSMNRRRHRSR